MAATIALSGALTSMALTGCGGGARPVLVENDTLDTAAPERAALLDPAPPGTPSLPVPADLIFQATAEDALTHWASKADVRYRGDCANPVQDAPAETILCHTSTGRTTEFLLGPSADETWYVISLAESDEGVEVIDTAIAGS